MNILVNESIDNCIDTVISAECIKCIHSHSVRWIFVSAQEMNPDWLHAASSLLVALGSRLPDMVRITQVLVLTEHEHNACV